MISSPGHSRSRRGIAASVAIAAIAAIAAVDAPFTFSGAGDYSYAEARFLDGSLLDLDNSLASLLTGEQAQSFGVTSAANLGTLDLGALGLRPLDHSGIILPLNFANAGVVGHYTSALNDGSSLASSGLIDTGGGIGASITPMLGVAPGPLNLSLSGALSNLGLSSAVVAQIAELDLQLGAASATASQVAPAAATGDYSIQDLQLHLTSPTLAAVMTQLNQTVGTAQVAVNGLNTTVKNSLSSVLGVLGVVTVTAGVTAPNLAAVVSPLTTSTISSPSYPGIALNLSTGMITVDLGAIIGLNGQPANTEILTSTTITTITTNLVGLLSQVLVSVDTALNTAINGIAITADARIGLGVDILNVNTTVGALRAGDLSGLALLGIGATLPGGLAVLANALLSPVNPILTLLSGLSSTLLVPVTSGLVPAIEPILSRTLGIRVNNKLTTAGRFTEVAMKITVLPDTPVTPLSFRRLAMRSTPAAVTSPSALSTPVPLILNVANATVGSNQLSAPATITTITPAGGPEVGGTVVTITGTNFTEATAVTFDGTTGTGFTVVDDTTITVTSPAHLSGPVNVIVQSTGGNSTPTTFTYNAQTVLNSVYPVDGSAAGGNVVTLQGSCFTGADQVLFGDVPAIAFTVINDTTIEVVVPPHASGVVSISVIGSNNCTDTILLGSYAFFSAPTPAPSVTVPAAPIVAPAAVPSPTIPATGAESRQSTALAAMLLAGGMALIAISRRRRALSIFTKR